MHELTIGRRDKLYLIQKRVIFRNFSLGDVSEQKKFIEGIEVPDVDKIRMDLSEMTEKQRQVVQATLSIPRGETATYGEVARKAGLPGAARFVGNVMATNRLYPLVPCHRVISSSGLGGYGLGIKKKIELLRREGAFAE